MIPVLLCIVVLVLSSGVVLRIVLEREDEPTGAISAPPPPQAPTTQFVAPRATGRGLVPTLPRHRARSSALLVVLAVIVGVLTAAAIGTVLALLAFALRSAVTS